MEGPATPWHSLAPEEALAQAGSRMGGLTKQESGERLARYGLNELTGKKKPPLIMVFLRQFLSPLIYVLLAAGIILNRFTAFSACVRLAGMIVASPHFTLIFRPSMVIAASPSISHFHPLRLT